MSIFKRPYMAHLTLCAQYLWSILKSSSQTETHAAIIRQHLANLERINSQILSVLRLRKPGLVFLVLVSERDSDSMADLIDFKFALPPRGAPDVQRRKLRWVIGELSDPANPDSAVVGEVKELEVAGQENETIVLTGKENQVIEGTLIDVDNANNQSEPSPFRFTLIDTFPPPKPGEVGFSFVGERTEPDPEVPPTDPVDPVDPPPSDPTDDL